MKNIRRILSVALVLALLTVCALAAEPKTYVTTAKLNLRAEPSRDGKLITTLPEGTTFYATDTATDETGTRWDFGNYNGRDGWVCEDYLQAVREPVVVSPRPVYLNVDALEDGLYPALFEKEDLVNENGRLILNNVHIFSENVYETAEVDDLRVGDTIVIYGENIVIENLTHETSVLINSTPEEIGFMLIMSEQYNGYVVCGEDDLSSYTDHGMKNFEIAENVVYNDEADPENPINGSYKNLAESFEAGPDYGYCQFNARIRVEGGRITGIERFYTP